MRCIFCKSVSDNSVSVEHVIPESLGNQEHVLPPGWVCDSCNNYIALKIEKPFLDSVFGRHSRFEMEVPNKKGRVPSAIGLYPKARCKVELFRTQEGLSILPADKADESRYIQTIRAGDGGRLFIPAAGIPEQSYETSRFIAKIALEVMALRILDIEGANEEIVDKPALDDIRNYVRRGRPGFVWPVNIRHIYSKHRSFQDIRNQEPYETLHEFDILPVRNEYYIVVAIFGVEFTINLGGPELDGFNRWLSENGNRSPLYSKKAV